MYKKHYILKTDNGYSVVGRVSVDDVPLIVSVGNDINIPAGSSAAINSVVSGGTSPYTYLWSPSSGLSNSNVQNPIATPTESTTYTLTVTDVNNNSASDSFVINIYQENEASFITQYGITWTFDQPYQVGQFITGDWWVKPKTAGGTVNVVNVNPSPQSFDFDTIPVVTGLTINSTANTIVLNSSFSTSVNYKDLYIIVNGEKKLITNYVGSTRTATVISNWSQLPQYNDSASIVKAWGTRNINGSMIDPVASWDHAYDDRLNHFIPSIGASFPLNLNINNSLISTISRKSVTSGIDLLYTQVGETKSFIDTAAILTCVSSTPSPNSFRPPYCGGNNKPQFNSTNINTNILPSLVPPTGYVFQDGSTRPKHLCELYASFYARPWILHVTDNGGQYIHPTGNMPNYHRELYKVESDAALLLLCNYANKNTLLIPYLQHAIDTYYVTTSTQGAHGDIGVSKLPVLIAGLLFNNVDMLNTNYNYYFTDEKTYYAKDKTSRTESQIVPSGYGWTGATSLWRQDVDTYEHEHLHPSGEWLWVSSSGHGIARESYRRSNSYSWVGMYLAGKVLNLKSTWKHDAFFDYMHRWMTEYDVDNKDYIKSLYYAVDPMQGTCESDFCKNFWDNYGSSY